MFLYWILWALFCICITRASLNLECVQTIHEHDDVYNKPIFVKPVQNYKPHPTPGGDLPIYFDPCSELADSKFAFHFDLPSSEATGSFGSHVVLCLTIAQRDRYLTENTTCFNFTIVSTEGKAEITCWAELLSYKETLLMKAHAAVHDGRRTYQLYSELHTPGIDDLCKMNHIEEFSVRRIHGCNASGHFNVNRQYVVKSIFAKDKHNITHLPFHMLDTGVAEFRLAPSMKGRYNLTITLYHTDLHMYFAVTSQINVICGLETISIPAPSTAGPNSVLSFQVFAVLATIGVTIIIIVVTLGILNFRGHINLVQCRRQARGHSQSPEMVSLNNAKDPNSHNGRTVSPKRFQPPLPTIPSQPSSSQSLATHAGVTDTKLDMNNIKAYKQIMVLPLSYDPFVRDLVSCLRDVLGFHGEVTIKCIYDEQVLDAYDRNKLDWTTGILNDSNTIVLVLCLTSLSCENRDKTRVDDILDHCKVTRERPMGQVYFVNMTGQDYGLHEYHGDTLVMENQRDIEQLAEKMFSKCGLDVGRDASFLTETFQSEQFVKLIRTVLHTSD